MKYRNGRPILYVNQAWNGYSKPGFLHHYQNIMFSYTDSEKGLVSGLYPIRRIRSSVLGHGATLDNEYAILVAHTDKTAMLHRHVVKTSRFSSACVGHDPDEDKATLERMIYHVEGHKKLLIDTGAEFFEVAGRFGSACVRQGRFGVVRVMTLYDMLIQLCQETGIYVMGYDQIRLYSSGKSKASRIILHHDLEADRFFVKMYMDVSMGVRKEEIPW